MLKQLSQITKLVIISTCALIATPQQAFVMPPIPQKAYEYAIGTLGVAAILPAANAAWKKGISFIKKDPTTSAQIAVSLAVSLWILNKFNIFSSTKSAAPAESSTVTIPPEKLPGGVILHFHVNSNNTFGGTFGNAENGGTLLSTVIPPLLYLAAATVGSYCILNQIKQSPATIAAIGSQLKNTITTAASWAQNLIGSANPTVVPAMTILDQTLPATAQILPVAAATGLQAMVANNTPLFATSSVQTAADVAGFFGKTLLPSTDIMPVGWPSQLVGAK